MHDLIILHGALGASKEFELVKEILSDVFQVHTLDFNGHGSNTDESVFYIDGFSNDLRKLISEKGLDTPFVFGYSMGGYVALYHEYLFPNSFSGILTLGTKFHWTPESSVKEAAFLEPKIVLEKVPQYAAYLEAIHPIGWERNMYRTQELMLRLGQDPALKNEYLSQIIIPVTISRGALDKMVSAEESEHVARSLVKGVYHEVLDMKHPIHQIEPNKIAELILNQGWHVL